MLEKLVDFFMKVLRLKRVPRSGWIYYGVRDPETVASHSFNVAFLSLILCEILKKEREIDCEKVLKMAILHELGEVELGDIHFEGRRLIGDAVEEGERRAVKEILEEAGLSSLYPLWEEFERAESFEAKLVRALDKIDLYLTALDYEETGIKRLDAFWKTEANRKHFGVHPLIEKIFKILKKRRNG